MIKNTLINFAFSILLTIVIITILFLTHGVDYIWLFLKRIRGTSDYEGEGKGLENLNITAGIIIPTVFVMSFVAVALFRRKRKINNVKKEIS
ncbi:MAG TPA: hypothetical protein VNX68_04665 [Nitrosopumilaceae archaeon]|jgi:hypothetical protein|nr:hypothetical protein [Nitrosopumilaceae archaeon]